MQKWYAPLWVAFKDLSSIDMPLIAVLCLFFPSTIVNRLNCFLHFTLRSDLRAVYILWFFLLLNNTFTAMPGLSFSNLSMFLIDTGNSSPPQFHCRLILSGWCLISLWCNASMTAHLKHFSSLFCGVYHCLFTFYLFRQLNVRPTSYQH